MGGEARHGLSMEQPSEAQELASLSFTKPLRWWQVVLFLVGLIAFWTAVGLGLVLLAAGI